MIYDYIILDGILTNVDVKIVAIRSANLTV